MKFNEKMSILYVEDDEIDVENLRRSFKKNNIVNPLHVAENGEVGLTMLRDEIIPLPHIILLDINMPKMNGLEFLAELRQDTRLKHIQVFILTTSSQDEDILKAHKKNVSGYIVKPVNSDKLITAVESLKGIWEKTEYPPAQS